MIYSEDILNFFKKKINFFCGVPDSVLKTLQIFYQTKNIKNIITHNEGVQ